MSSSSPIIDFSKSETDKDSTISREREEPVGIQEGVGVYSAPRRNPKMVQRNISRWMIPSPRDPQLLQCSSCITRYDQHRTVDISLYVLVVQPSLYVFIHACLVWKSHLRLNKRTFPSCAFWTRSVQDKCPLQLAMRSAVWCEYTHCNIPKDIWTRVYSFYSHEIDSPAQQFR